MKLTTRAIYPTAQGPKRAGRISDICCIYLVCKSLHCSICAVSSGPAVGRAFIFIFALCPEVCLNGRADNWRPSGVRI